MGMAEEFKDLKRRTDSLRTEWEFMNAAISKLTSEYGYVSDDPFQRLDFIKTIKRTFEDFDKKYGELSFEIYRLQEVEDNKLLELEAANNTNRNKLMPYIEVTEEDEII